MVYFQTESPSLDKFRKALEWEKLVRSMYIWQFGIYVLGTAIWYIL
jgi:hypothetical protein